MMVSPSWSSQSVGKTEKYHILVREVLVRTYRKPLARCGWSGKQSSSLDLREGMSGFFFFLKECLWLFFSLIHLIGSYSSFNIQLPLSAPSPFPIRSHFIIGVVLVSSTTECKRESYTLSLSFYLCHC